MKSYLECGDVRQCCSCRACEQVCPKQCITMVQKNGFLYPVVDEEKCVKCGLCIQVCQFSGQGIEMKRKALNVFAGWNKKKEQIEQSTSGGIFPVLAEYVIEQGGYVFGAAFNEQLVVNMHMINDKKDISMVQGSKYVRSDTNTTYRQVKNLLEKEEKVLYSGTPCQIAGLKSYLRKDYEKLICVDLICHGVPTELLFEKYKEYIERTNNLKITSFRFRSKKAGVMSSEYCIKLSNGKEIREALNKNPYSLTYNSLIAHMPSCNSCPYTSLQRVSDITIGDFWGIEKIDPMAVNPRGTSLIFVNSRKGQNIIEEVKQELELFQEKGEDAQRFNPPLRHSTKKHPMSEKFIKELAEKPFEKVYKKYIYWGNKWMLFYRLIRKIKEKLIRE